MNSPLWDCPSLMSFANFSPTVSIVWKPGKAMLPFKSVVVRARVYAENLRKQVCCSAQNSIAITPIMAFWATLLAT